MTINDKPEKKNKIVAIKTNVEDDEEQVEENTDENLTESIAILTKIFVKVMRRHDKR